MFDDPRKTLVRLEIPLPAAGKQDDEFERLYSEIYDEFGPREKVRSLHPLPAQESWVRNYANGYGQNLDDSQDADQSAVLMDEDCCEPPQPRRKHTLEIFACTECIAIAAVMVYCIIRLLP